MWIPIIKADAPSLNNNIYPESALKEAAKLPVCKIYSTYCKPGENGGFIADHENPAVGEVLAWTFDDSWLRAEVHFYCPHFASLVKDGYRVLRAATVAKTVPEDIIKSVRHIVIVIDKIDHLAVCFVGDASWTVLNDS